MTIFNHNITARDMPELRLDMISDSKAFQRHPYAAGAHAWWPHFQQADLYWVTHELRTRARLHADSLPMLTFTKEDLPSLNGILVWEHVEHNMAGFAWKTVGQNIVLNVLVPKDFGIHQILEATGGRDTEDRLRRNPDVTSALWSVLELAVPLDTEFDPLKVGIRTTFQHEYDEMHTKLVTKMAAALWILIKETLVVETRVRPSRHGMKRIARMDASLLTETRYVTLRKRAAEPTYGEGTGQHLSYRSQVRGYERIQRYGPGLTEVKKIWIESYIRGPEGARLLDPSKLVNLLRK